MPKISALPPIAALAADDETPAVDDSASSTGKFTVQQILTWLQTQTDWVKKSMVDYDDEVAWEELGRATLGSAASSMTLSGLTGRTYLRIIVTATKATLSPRIGIRFNNDSGSKYNTRQSSNGSADTTGGPYTEVRPTTGNIGQREYAVLDVLNIASAEKLYYNHSVENGANGTGTDPDRREQVGKWVETSNQITRVDLVNANTGTFAAGSTLIVLGRD